MVFSFPKQELISCTLSDLDFTDRRFPFSYGPLPETFLTSVEQIGIAVPPLLIHGPRGHVIVCGRRRLEAASAVFPPAQTIEARMVEADDEQRLFSLALWDNLAHRSFNLVETADIVWRLEELYDEPTIRADFLPHLGVPSKRRYLERYRAIVQLSPTIRLLLARGAMDGETVDIIKSWPAEDHELLMTVAHELVLNRNKLRQTVQNVDDLARRDGKKPAQVIHEVANSLPEGCHSAADFRQQLQVRLFPCLSAQENRFREFCSSLQLPRHVHLVAPPNFEGDEYTLEIRFRSPAEWRSACKWVSNLEGNRLDELFND
ncbi:MAG: ParB/RepB/Spo0J family partition protein [Deltaproteobacteria bacterium]|nr:ParB/RepB/Spo0J family partition protein [Candidatus Anaeroferrophillus wilburensis]MBN2889868.1 ParB/RepB/Spo0J family partition protein [Deltaproteobacteria bacterium]